MFRAVSPGKVGFIEAALFSQDPSSKFVAIYLVYKFISDGFKKKPLAGTNWLLYFMKFTYYKIECILTYTFFSWNVLDFSMRHLGVH